LDGSSRDAILGRIIHQKKAVNSALAKPVGKGRIFRMCLSWQFLPAQRCPSTGMAAIERHDFKLEACL
jgi:hypothetical protein